MKENQPPSEEALFDAALQLKSEAERLAFLNEKCGSDEVLRDSILGLLRGYEKGKPLDNAIPIEGMAEGLAWPGDPVSEGPGTRIGRYKILQQIGEGGFGMVYLAEQQEPLVRRVALKIIKLGMDTKQVIARFEAERQALAMMDHPNIAKVLDAGATDTGRPYFVMELVTGVPITRYCDDAQLDAKERLELFVPVCQAVQHAHQKGIIHRDLKPSNVMVTLHDGVPVPKVIDFGVAKALNQRLTERTLFTNYAQMVGTPAYMSPEQAEMSGLDIDTRCDIYSLGVLLYEMLTGKTPHNAKRLSSVAYGEMQRIIREEEPPKPSTRLTEARKASHQGDTTELGTGHSAFPNELDWVVMKALEKDRRRRYETANEFAQDIRRFLNDEPVSAAAPSVFYRVGKFVRRNRLVVGASAVVTAAVLAGLVVSTALLLETQKAKKVAETEALRSASVSAFLKKILTSAGPSVAQGRDTALLREILDSTTVELDQLAAEQPEVAAELQHTLGVVYRDLGEYPKAETMLRASYESRLQIRGEKDLQTLSVLADLAHIQLKLGKLEQAVVNSERAVELFSDIPGDHADRYKAMQWLSSSYYRMGRKTAALEIQREVVAGFRRTLGPKQLQTLIAMNSLGTKVGDGGKACAIWEETLELARSALGERHPFTLLVGNNVLYSLRVRGEFEKALALANADLETSIEVNGEEHLDTGHQRIAVAVSQESLGQIAEAIEESGQALEIFRRNDNPSDITGATRLLGSLFARHGDWDVARQHCEEVVAQKAFGDGDNSIDWLRLGAVYARLGDHDAYEGFCQRSLDAFELSEKWGQRERAAKSCLLMPLSDSALRQRAIALAEGISDDDAGNAPNQAPWAALCRGLAEYRADRFQTAIEWLAEEELAGAPGICRGAALAVQAMAAKRAGDDDGATRLLGQASEIIEPGMERENWNLILLPNEINHEHHVPWHDWMICLLVLEEAREVVLGEAP